MQKIYQGTIIAKDSIFPHPSEERKHKEAIDNREN
jgi:hypothetical protein